MVTHRSDLVLANLTGRDFAAAARSNPAIILPLGSHEDHGPFLPMGDYLLAETLALRIAAACNEKGVVTFVAPTMPFGVADYFGSSPGGMAISPASFKGLLRDLLDALLRHNLTRIIILNGHGGNAPVIHEVTLGLKLSSGPIIPSVYLWKIAHRLMERCLGDSEPSRFGHGAEPLLSLSMALRRQHVSNQQSSPVTGPLLLGLPVSGFGTIDFKGVPIDMPAEFDQVPGQAAYAAKPLASAALGKSIAAELVATIAEFIVHYASQTG